MRSKRPLARQCKKLAKQYVDDPDVPAAPNGDSGYAEWVQIALILMRVELDKSLRDTEAWFNDSTAILDDSTWQLLLTLADRVVCVSFEPLVRVGTAAASFQSRTIDSSTDFAETTYSDSFRDQ